MNRKNVKVILQLTAVLLMISLISCDPGRKLAKQEKEDIQDYLSQNSTLAFVKKPSGLYYLEVTAGTGISAVRTDSAYVKYTGKFLNGTVFDSNVSSGKLYGFIVGQNITGFDEGITLMKQGGKATLLIPSSLGYGSVGTYGISGYTPLLFDIELVKVVQYTDN
ncbi:MAG: FKBP-type peptidyl-prolyl cis-trans isomerase [Bacteroidales bacterium]|nr:FKBP-type peptidyl-prolyl cis-trans isomerase [Bacteroidales bacterium]